MQNEFTPRKGVDAPPPRATGVDGGATRSLAGLVLAWLLTGAVQGQPPAALTAAAPAPSVPQGRFVKNPVVCGVLLFAGDVALDVDAIIRSRAPEPLAAVLPGSSDPSLKALLENRGAFFAKKHYQPEPLPIFAETKARLPAPIFDENPDAVRCYWKAWELAFNHFRRPAPGSPFVSNYIDENFNSSLFLWDTAFMTMF